MCDHVSVNLCEDCDCVPSILRQGRLLKIPKKNLETFGERSFSYIAHKSNNCLELAAGQPESFTLSLQTFKAELETHLFLQAFFT